MSVQEDYINELYARKLEAKRRALAEAYAANVSALEDQAAQIAPAYRNARNSTAGAAGTQRRNFAEYAAARSISTGAASQSELARSIALQSELSALDAGESAAVTDAAKRRAALSAEYQTSLGAAEDENQSARLEALYGERVRAQEAAADKEAADAALQFKYDQLEYEKEKDAAEAEAKAAALDAAKTSSSKGGSGYSYSAGANAAGTDEKNLKSLFEDMKSSGQPYTYLMANAKGYGFASTAAEALDSVYNEYLKWSEALGGGSYTEKQRGAYDEVLTRLAASSGEKGSDPVEYIDRLVSSVGVGIYTDLMGAELYARLRSTVGSWASAYAAMKSSGDPKAWLKSNGGSLSPELKAWLSAQSKNMKG